MASSRRDIHVETGNADACGVHRDFSVVVRRGGPGSQPDSTTDGDEWCKHAIAGFLPPEGRTRMTAVNGPLVASITFDCTDALALAQFWSAALGRAVGHGGTKECATVQGEPPWTFMAVPESKNDKNRVHVDLLVGDLASEVARLVDLGATRLAEFKEGGYEWVTLADPEGNEFDVAVEA
jgi:hypothetical protein